MAINGKLKLGLLMLPLSVAACNAGPLLKTGSLSKPSAAPVVKPSTSVDRALHVGATSARAQKCGFYFDAAALRANFMTAEATRGTQPDMLTRSGQSYDFTAKTIAKKITNSETYCNRTRTATIKASLQAALGGNYDPPLKKAKVDDGAFAGLFETDNRPEVFNPDHLYDPLLNPDATKKVEQE